MSATDERPRHRGRDRRGVGRKRQGRSLRRPRPRPRAAFAYTNFGQRRAKSPARYAHGRYRYAARYVREQCPPQHQEDHLREEYGAGLGAVGNGGLDFPRYAVRPLFADERVHARAGWRSTRPTTCAPSCRAGRSRRGFGASGHLVRRRPTHDACRRPRQLQLQVAAALPHRPGYRPEAERRWRQSIQPELAAARRQREHGLVGERACACSPRATSASARSRMMAMRRPLLRRTQATSSRLGLTTAPSRSPSSATSRARPPSTLVAKTFGALPKRESIADEIQGSQPAKIPRR